MNDSVLKSSEIELYDGFDSIDCYNIKMLKIFADFGDERVTNSVALTCPDGLMSAVTVLPFTLLVVVFVVVVVYCG